MIGILRQIDRRLCHYSPCGRCASYALIRCLKPSGSLCLGWLEKNEEEQMICGEDDDRFFILPCRQWRSPLSDERKENYRA
jgi:hypothetical protein